MVTNPGTGLEEEIASPGFYGSFPWADRCRNIYGIVLAYNPGEVRRAHFMSFQLTALARKAVGGCVETVGMGKGMHGAGPGTERFRPGNSGDLGQVLIREEAPSGPLFRGLDGRLWNWR